MDLFVIAGLQEGIVILQRAGSKTKGMLSLFSKFEPVIPFSFSFLKFKSSGNNTSKMEYKMIS